MSKALIDEMTDPFTKKDLGTRVFIFCPGCREYHFLQDRLTEFTGHKRLWTFNYDIQKPTFNPSLKVQGKYLCHSFIRDGKIIFLKDCTHELKGQTVDLPDTGLTLISN